MAALLRSVGRSACVGSLAIAVTFSVACKKDVPAAGGTSTVPTVIGNLVWVSGDRPDAPLSQISRMAVDAKQRVYAPDIKESAVFVFGADGAFLTKIGRKGSGPGEFDRGCCAALDARGRLWVKDAGNARYVVFAMTDTGAGVVAKPAFVVPLPHQDANWGPALWIDARNSVISVGHVHDQSTNSWTIKHFVVDTSGHLLQTVDEPQQTENITKPVEHTTSDGRGVSTRYLYQPFSATELRANGPEGTFAVAGSGAYSVRWFSPTGALLHTITQDVVGPELSPKDRLAADSELVATAKEAQTTVALLPFKVPSRKPPLYAIFFDADGRLWVQHTTLQGVTQQADVYDTNGALAFHAAWPAGIRIAYNGVVRGNTAWGVQLDDNDVPHVVRMEFASAR